MSQTRSNKNIPELCLKKQSLNVLTKVVVTACDSIVGTSAISAHTFAASAAMPRKHASLEQATFSQCLTGGSAGDLGDTVHGCLDVHFHILGPHEHELMNHGDFLQHSQAETTEDKTKVLHPSSK